MKSVLYISVILALLLAACARQQAPAVVQAGRQVTTEAEAIAVVQAEIQRHGGDPRREECSATKTDDGWYVTAWHIFYPTNTGSSRFVPGGFTDYKVGKDGKILETIPGH